VGQEGKGLPSRQQAWTPPMTWSPPSWCTCMWFGKETGNRVKGIYFFMWTRSAMEALKFLFSVSEGPSVQCLAEAGPKSKHAFLSMDQVWGGVIQGQTYVWLVFCSGRDTRYTMYRFHYPWKTSHELGPDLLSTAPNDFLFTWASETHLLLFLWFVKVR
jgi:hypothetical protein